MQTREDSSQDGQAAVTPQPRAASAAVDIVGLRKNFRSRGRRIVALDGLDMRVPRGSIHGFLGPESSGKTTTLRVLMALTRAKAGSMQLLGQPVPRNLDRVVGKIGAMIGEPSFASPISGRRNLLRLARMIGLPQSRVDQSLAQVGITTEAKSPVHSYSPGTLRRLGIAAALLKDPELLILDDPTNGVDSSGISDLLGLFTHLAEAGTTVLLSSHDLTEVQQLCTSVSLIDQGKLLAQGGVSELLSGQTTRIRVGVSNPARAHALLTQAGHRVQWRDEGLIVAGREHPEMISRLLAEEGMYLRELTTVRPSLSDLYLELTGRTESATSQSGPSASGPSPSGQASPPGAER